MILRATTVGLTSSDANPPNESVQVKHHPGQLQAPKAFCSIPGDVDVQAVKKQVIRSICSAQTHGTCGLRSKIDANRQINRGSRRLTTLSAHTVLGSWRCCDRTGPVAHRLDHFEDIGWTGSNTLRASNA